MLYMLFLLLQGLVINIKYPTIFIISSPKTLAEGDWEMKNGMHAKCFAFSLPNNKRVELISYVLRPVGVAR